MRHEKRQLYYELSPWFAMYFRSAFIPKNARYSNPPRSRKLIIVAKNVKLNLTSSNDDVSIQPPFLKFSILE